MPPDLLELGLRPNAHMRTHDLTVTNMHSLHCSLFCLQHWNTLTLFFLQCTHCGLVDHHIILSLSQHTPLQVAQRRTIGKATGR